MEFEKTLKEYQAFPKNAELVEKLLTLQDETVKAGDAEAFLKATALLTDTYLFLQQTEDAVAMLSAVLRDNAFEDAKTILAIIDRLVALLLKTEDFVQLDQVLQYRSRFVVGVPAQMMMQQFYLSVCYEGLRQYDRAIAALNAVADSASNANIAAKYLKLAMLYLRVHDIDAAKNAYEHALVFDKAKKNEMFCLVESDILFAEGRTLNALKAYQDFFLRSKTKTRYLDRYITINARLGNFEEAWRFYKEYEKKVSANVSKNYRLELYEAGLAVAEALRKYDEAAQIRERILQLAEKEAEIVDSFDGIRALLEATNRIPPDKDRRDIVLETFRALQRVMEVARLLFVAPAPEGVLVETFSKGLLLDKTLASGDLRGSVVGAIIEADRDYDLLTPQEYGDLTDHLENRPLRDGPHRAIVGLAVRPHGSTAGFIVAYLDKDRHFDYASRLLMTARLVLEGRFDVSRLRDEDRARLATAEAVFNGLGAGLFRIESGYLFLLDERAKRLLGTDKAFLPFEEFQRCLGDKPLYVDDFVGKRELVFPLTGFDGRKMLWKAIVRIEDAAIHFAASDVLADSVRDADRALKAERTRVLGLGSAHAFADAIANAQTQYALGTFAFRNLPDATFSEWTTASQHLADAVRETVGTHLVDLYQGEDGTLLALFDTIDKRVLDRIAKDALVLAAGRMATAIPRFIVPDVRVGIVNVLRNRTPEESLEKAHQALLATTREMPLRYYDRDLLLQETRIDAVSEHLRSLLATGDGIAARYAAIGDPVTRRVELVRASLHPDPLLGDALLLRAAVLRDGLSAAVSRALLGAVARDVESLGTLRAPLAFAVPIHPAALVVPGGIEEILKILKRRKFPLARLVLVIVPDGIVPVAAIRGLTSSLAAAGCRFAYDGRGSAMMPWGGDDLGTWDYVFADPITLAGREAPLWGAFAAATGATIIAGPVDDAAEAARLSSSGIVLVEGALLPTYDTAGSLGEAFTPR